MPFRQISRRGVSGEKERLPPGADIVRRENDGTVVAVIHDIVTSGLAHTEEERTICCT
jgi:orotate phosphoribosyltransferase